MGRKTKKGDLLNASEDLFIEYGIEKVKIKDICEESNVSKVTFYKYFRNKSDLVIAILDKKLEEDYHKMEEILRTSFTFKEEINKMIDYEVNDRRMEFYTNNIEYLKTQPEVSRHMEKQQQIRIDRGLEWIESCKERGRIKADLKIEFILTIFKKMFEMFEDKELLSHYENGRDLMNDIDQFFFYGIVGERF